MSPDFALVIFAILFLAFFLTPLLHHFGFFWPGRVATFKAFAEAHGMEVGAEHHYLEAKKTLPGGGRLRLTLAFTEGKHRRYLLQGALTLKGCPKCLTLRAESLWTGFRRLLGAREAHIEDPELDAAFWVECSDLEQLQAYLTPIRRRGLLEVLAYLPKYGVENRQVRVEHSYLLPWGDRRRLQRVFGSFSELDEALNGQGEKLAQRQTKHGHIQAIRVRQSWPASSLLLFWLLGLGGMTEGVVGQVFVALSLLGLLLLLLALAGTRLGRLLLQGYFAFATLVLLCYVVAGFMGLYENPQPENPTFFLLVVLGSATFTWAMRHFLKDLVPSPQSKKSMEF